MTQTCASQGIDSEPEVFCFSAWLVVFVAAIAGVCRRRPGQNSIGRLTGLPDFLAWRASL